MTAFSRYLPPVNIGISAADACHGFAPEHGETAAFFCRVFGVERRRQGRVQPLAEEELYATKTGNVLGDFDDALTIPDETAAQAEKLRLGRKKDRAREWLTERVQYARIPWKPWLRLPGHGNDLVIGGYTGKGAVWWVQKQLAAFGVFISKGDNATLPDCPVAIALWDNGTQAIAEHSDWIRGQCEAGRQVLVVDLPGTGTLEQTQLWHYKGTLYKVCCDLFYMDDSMGAMQTYHLLRTVDMLREVLHLNDISFYCDGCEGVYGIMAGYLGGLPREYGKNLLCSVDKQIILERPRCQDLHLQTIIPGMLEFFDYDELM